MNSFNNSLRYYLRGSVSIIVLTFLYVLPATAQMVPGAASPKPSEVLTNDGPLKAQLDDRSFVENAASSGLAEVEMAKLAKAKSHNKKIVAFADTMLRDHTAANAKLKQIAAQLHLTVPSALNNDQKKLLTEMNGLTGDAFDRLYAEVMRKEHDTAVGLFDNAAGETKLNAQLRTFAAETLNKLREHQQRAHGLINS